MKNKKFQSLIDFIGQQLENLSEIKPTKNNYIDRFNLAMYINAYIVKGQNMYLNADTSMPTQDIIDFDNKISICACRLYETMEDLLAEYIEKRISISIKAAGAVNSTISMPVASGVTITAGNGDLNLIAAGDNNVSIISGGGTVEVNGASVVTKQKITLATLQANLETYARERRLLQLVAKNSGTMAFDYLNNGGTPLLSIKYDGGDYLIDVYYSYPTLEDNQLTNNNYNIYITNSEAYISNLFSTITISSDPTYTTNQVEYFYFNTEEGNYEFYLL